MPFLGPPSKTGSCGGVRGESRRFLFNELHLQLTRNAAIDAYATRRVLCLRFRPALTVVQLVHAPFLFASGGGRFESA